MTETGKSERGKSKPGKSERGTSKRGTYKPGQARAAEYRAHLDRCLDDRRDPLEEPEIVAFLEAHPEHLDEFARLRESLQDLERSPPAQPQPPGAIPGPRTVELVAAALVAAAAGIALWFVLANPHSEADATPRVSEHRVSEHSVSAPGASEPGVSEPEASKPAVAADTGPQLRPPRILSASLQEQAPMLQAAARYTVHESLVRTETTLLEAYEHRSQAR